MINFCFRFFQFSVFFLWPGALAPGALCGGVRGGGSPPPRGGPLLFMATKVLLNLFRQQYGPTAAPSAGSSRLTISRSML